MRCNVNVLRTAEGQQQSQKDFFDIKLLKLFKITFSLSVRIAMMASESNFYEKIDKTCVEFLVTIYYCSCCLYSRHKYFFSFKIIIIVVVVVIMAFLFISFIKTNKESFSLASEIEDSPKR